MKTKIQLLIFPALFLLASEPGLADRLIDFENGTVASKPLDWLYDSDSSNVDVDTTTTSGDYTGGQAIRTGNTSGASYAALRYVGPMITSLQADFLWDFSATNTPTIIVYAWDDDDNDGFQAAERTVGFGLDNDGQFELNRDIGGELPGTTNFAADTWYRLTMTWSEPDGSGDRVVTLSALDLTNSSDLGVVSSATMTAAEFGVDPEEWDGVAFRMTRGTIDNIGCLPVSEPPYAYIDASPSNTTLNSDPVNFPDGVALDAGVNYIDDGSGGSGTDGLWTFRTSFSTFENGNAFETDNANIADDAEDTFDLITTANLPTAGTYELVAVFSRGNNRDIAARTGSSPDSGDIFDTNNAINANQNSDPLMIEFDSSFTDGRGGNSGIAYLGKVTTTTDNEDVQVFVNGFARTAAVDDERTHYDGLGYRLISGTSEPFSSEIVNFTYSSVDGSSQVSITGAPGVRYKLVEADDLDFSNPDLDPVPLTGVSVGNQDVNEVIANSSGDATVQFILSTGKDATFIRAVSVP